MPGARVAEGERVSLRTVEREDLSFVQQGCANPGLRYPLGNPVRTREEIGESIGNGNEGEDRFLVCLDGDDAGPVQPDEADVRRIGVVSVGDTDWRRPELGYWIVSTYSPSISGTSQ